MSQACIFYPALALAWWTLLVLLLVPYRRLSRRTNRGFKISDFELGESASATAYVALANRNFVNLLELPVLFYLACVILFATAAVDSVAVTLAWLYVVARVIHSLVHDAGNSVPVRFCAFVVSNLFLLGLMVLSTVSVLRLA
jgi:hypothetical protein